MQMISIRELHARTGQWVRKAARHGPILVTDNGRPIAKLLPEATISETPYFARRKFISPAFGKLIERGEVGCAGTDATVAITEDRDDRI